MWWRGLADCLVECLGLDECLGLAAGECLDGWCEVIPGVDIGVVWPAECTEGGWW